MMPWRTPASLVRSSVIPLMTSPFSDNEVNFVRLLPVRDKGGAFPCRSATSFAIKKFAALYQGPAPIRIRAAAWEPAASPWLFREPLESRARNLRQHAMRPLELPIHYVVAFRLEFGNDHATGDVDGEDPVLRAV